MMMQRWMYLCGRLEEMAQEWKKLDESFGISYGGVG
jgi:hypothetical protein